MKKLFLQIKYYSLKKMFSSYELVSILSFMEVKVLLIKVCSVELKLLGSYPVERFAEIFDVSKLQKKLLKTLHIIYFGFKISFSMLL